MSEKHFVKKEEKLCERFLRVERVTGEAGAAVVRLTRSLASILCPPRNHSTAMPSYDSSHSKMAVSPAVTVTSFRGWTSVMDRAEGKDMVSSFNK